MDGSLWKTRIKMDDWGIPGYHYFRNIHSLSEAVFFWYSPSLPTISGLFPAKLTAKAFVKGGLEGIFPGSLEVEKLCI